MINEDNAHVGIAPTLLKANLELSKYFVKSTYQTMENKGRYKYE